MPFRERLKSLGKYLYKPSSGHRERNAVLFHTVCICLSLNRILCSCNFSIGLSVIRLCYAEIQWIEDKVPLLDQSIDADRGV